MEQKANITIDNHHITVERMQTACGREIRVLSVFPRHGSETVEDKLKALAELDFQHSTTAITSAFFTVESRWAMIIVVLPSLSSSSDA